MARCRARTKKGAGPLCTRKVREAGLRCWQHKGLPTAPPRASKASGTRKRKSGSTTRMREQERRRRATIRATRAEEKNRERVQLAADYCTDILSSGWADAVAERAAEYVTKATWNRLFQSRVNHCKALARLAKAILYGRDRLHQWVGTFVAWILSLIGIGAVAREFAGELASNIPIPMLDAKALAVSRGLQVTGILLCVVRDDELAGCQCFIDLALVEAKTRVKKILITAMDDWVRLAESPPKSWRQVA
jgi:hypothetical protein